MRDFTKEEIAELATIEQRLWQTQHGYLSTLHSDQKEMVERIYRAAGGTRRVVWGCGRCWLDIVKEMAVIYFRQKAEAEALAAAMAETKATAVKKFRDETATEPKPKAPRNKKTTAK